MKEGNKGLVKKIFWTHNITNLEGLSPLKRKMVESCQRLEYEGFGMLEDPLNPGKVDESGSVVCPDKSPFTILTIKQIELYWEEKYKVNRGIYNSDNKEDIIINKAQIYYLGFIEP
jgi:hypothetical protein